MSKKLNIKGVANAFSLQMVEIDGDYSVDVKKLTKSEFEQIKEGVPSFVGHQDTAACLGVDCNRGFLSLYDGESVLVAQLVGGRLPEGCTTLPEGFSFRYILCTVRGA